MIVGIFEDKICENFFPLTYMRPVYELRCGAFTLRERIERALEGCGVGGRKLLIMRDYLEKVFRKKLSGYLVNEFDKIDDDLLLINGRLLAEPEIVKKIVEALGEEGLILKEGELIAAKLKASRAEGLKEALRGLKFEELVSKLKGEVKTLELAEACLLKYPWDIIVHNTELLKKDLEGLMKGKESAELPPNVAVVGPKDRLYIAEGVEIEPFVVFVTKSGPIYVSEGVKIQAGSRIEGPTFIGPKTYIIGGAQIREGSNIGPVCRVGGELEESVIHGYTNKYHYGFIGHAYVCEWVNLGAGTTNSDLKNTYGRIKVTVKGERVDTGLIKCGCFIGDMAKTSIGTLIYTGKKVGVAAHVHGVATRDVPSFTMWAETPGTKPIATEFYLESAIEVQRRMMARRDLTLSPEEEELIRKVFELTAPEREAAGVVKGRFSL